MSRRIRLGREGEKERDGKQHDCPEHHQHCVSFWRPEIHFDSLRMTGLALLGKLARERLPCRFGTLGESRTYTRQTHFAVACNLASVAAMAPLLTVTAGTSIRWMPGAMIAFLAAMLGALGAAPMCIMTIRRVTKWRHAAVAISCLFLSFTPWPLASWLLINIAKWRGFELSP